ncbi:HNH endonuclease [Nocardia yunnanensis]|uniref:HNH endonuclease n=1 Tax=Nocardia yunnanensis TaxID=2382165 RepID=A0A386ZGZ9_9NOCA|nr:HNH endonuclease signature motif containing protein [Nocardia yunnanensis]AYF76473.1 HNH endonuclease [Nocardia yunnanensis]
MNSMGVTFDNCGITELVTAVETLSTTISHATLIPFTDSDVVALMQQLETCKRKLSALDSKLIIEASDRSLPEASGAGKLVPFLRQTLGLSAHDASVRVKITHECGEFTEPGGHPRPATLPVAAEAFAAGALSRDHVRHIVDIMTHLPTDIPVETRVDVEQVLVEQSCEGLFPDDLPKIGREILARLDPDGTVINDADRRRRRGLVIGRPGVDGMSWVEGWITPELRACLDAVLAKFARPGMCNAEDPESPGVPGASGAARTPGVVVAPGSIAASGAAVCGLPGPAVAGGVVAGGGVGAADSDVVDTGAAATNVVAAGAAAHGVVAEGVATQGFTAQGPAGPGVGAHGRAAQGAGVAGAAGGAVVDSAVLEAAARRDRRDAGQRNHDALLALLQAGVDMNKLGSHRGLPVQITLTMSLADLERGAGIATTATGGHLSINEALKMAAGSKPVLAVLDGDGIPLYLGRSRERLATPGQRLALIARDKGCTHPDCDAPAAMCAAHHVVDWAKGGPTDLDNLALVCDHHHALVNDSEYGWATVMMGKDSPHRGRVGWIAPAAVDPSRTPRVNEKHHAGQRVATSIAARCHQWGPQAA